MATAALLTGVIPFCPGARASTNNDTASRLIQVQGTLAEQTQQDEEAIRYYAPHQNPTCITNAPPSNYDENCLSRALRQRLAPQEAAAITNPLTANREMIHWAWAEVSGATNETQKVRMLFDALTPHVKIDSLAHAHALTTQQVFDELKKTDHYFHCGEAAFLYTALARAVGVKAYVVSVEETVDGLKSPHGCAAVYINGRRCWLTFPMAGSAYRIGPTRSWTTFTSWHITIRTRAT